MQQTQKTLLENIWDGLINLIYSDKSEVTDPVLIPAAEPIHTTNTIPSETNTPDPVPVPDPTPAPNSIPKVITNYSEQSKLNNAAKNGDLGTIQSFIDNGFSVNVPYFNPLNEAIRNQQYEAAKLLLENGAILNDSQLKVAINNRDANMAQLLISHGINVNTYDPNAKISHSSVLSIALNTSTLFQAILKSDQALVDVLTAAHADEALMLKPIHIAALQGDVDELNALLEADASVNETDALGIKPLYYAAAMNHPEVIAVLVQHGANVNEHFPILEEINEVFTHSFQLTTPLHVAASTNAHDALSTLVQYDANINEYNQGHKTPLYVAVDSLNDESVKTLLEAGADPFLGYFFYNNLPEHYQNLIVDNLCAYKNRPFDVGHVYTPPSDYPHYRHSNYHFHDHLSFDYDKEQLLKAVINGDLKNLQSIIAEHPLFDYKSSLYLSEAIFHDQIEIAKWLISMGAEIEGHFYRYSLTPLEMAVEKNNVEMVKYLLEHGVNANGVEASNLSPITISINNGNVEIAKILVEAGALLYSADDPYNNSSIFDALHDKNYEMISYLISEGVPVKTLEVLFAMENQEPSTLQLLIESVEDINAQDTVYPLLAYAVTLNNIPAIHALLDNGIDRNVYQPDYMQSSRDPYDNKPIEVSNAEKAYDTSALFNAIVLNRSEIIEILLDNGVDQNLELSPIDLAIISNDRASFESLLLNDPQLAISEDSLGIKPLYYAAALDRVEMLDTLISLGADVNEKIALDETSKSHVPDSPLMVAVESAAFFAAEKLLQHGAIVDIADHSGSTLLENSIEHPKITELLVDHGATLFTEKTDLTFFQYLNDYYSDNYQTLKEILLSEVCPAKPADLISLNDVIDLEPSIIKGFEEATLTHSVNVTSINTVDIIPYHHLPELHSQEAELYL